jgi:hypothetical protein
MLGKPIIYWDGLFVCGTKPQRKNRQWHWVWSILTFCKQFLDCHNNFTACIAHSLARTTCLFTSHGVTKFPFTCLLVLRSCGYYSNWNDLSLFLPQQKGIWSDVNTNWDFLLDHIYLFETFPLPNKVHIPAYHGQYHLLNLDWIIFISYCFCVVYLY